MQEPGEGAEHGVRPMVALGLAVVTFIALVVCGLGIASLVTDADVISAPGLGPLPGVIGVAVAAGALAAVLGPALKAPHPSFVASLWATLACYLAYLAGVWVSAVAGGVGVATATGVAGRLAIGWWGPIVAAAGFVCAWGVIALRRTRARRPRWPWEGDDEV